MSELRVLFVTIGPADADAYVQAMCRERLVACGNIIPGVTSHYWWDGALQRDEEAVVLMETTTDRLDEAMRRAVQLHPYDTPKVVALPPAAVADGYLRWLRAETAPRPG
jgi:periplasmic divalent cation tolerance protein